MSANNEQFEKHKQEEKKTHPTSDKINNLLLQMERLYLSAVLSLSSSHQRNAGSHTNTSQLIDPSRVSTPEFPFQPPTVTTASSEVNV